MCLSGENYKVVGLFLRSMPCKEIINYLFKLMKKINIKPDDRRINLRIETEETQRCFAFIIDKEISFSSKLLNISLGGFKGKLDNQFYFQNLYPGKELKLVNIYIKAFHIVSSCRVVFLNEPYFSVQFIYLSDKDKENLCLALFNLLQENKCFLLD